jgi:hypothetical protein
VLKRIGMIVFCIQHDQTAATDDGSDFLQRVMVSAELRIASYRARNISKKY